MKRGINRWKFLKMIFYNNKIVLPKHWIKNLSTKTFEFQWFNNLKKIPLF
jgi:hypothetical protein